jgi:1-phosphofructokinase family hexose kinase
MILCITPNTAIDLTMRARPFAPGDVLRASASHAAAGGKGVNVARVLRRLGSDALCAGFIAGRSGAYLAQLAADEGLAATWTPLPLTGETRFCVILAYDGGGDESIVNGSGPAVNAASWASFRTDALAAAASCSAICVCGSLPPGSTPALFADFLTALVATGLPVWVDTHSEPLTVACAVPGINIKVNARELRMATGVDIAQIDAAQAFQRERGLARLVVTQGAHGATLLGEDSPIHVTAPKIESVSAAGSGDSLLAGLLHGFERGTSERAALRQGVAAGAANALSIGGGQFSMETFHALLAQIPA